MSSLIICNAPVRDARMRSHDSSIRGAILGFDACRPLCDAQCYDAKRDARMRSAMSHRILESQRRILESRFRRSATSRSQGIMDFAHLH